MCDVTVTNEISYKSKVGLLHRKTTAYRHGKQIAFTETIIPL